ncbi:hypothetical protein D8674_012186 [Pyrus ussuriensis x Pyrus communis]|uniref:Uncharacterized protein n=1 Tax=Pyrus ussuriensis x Pyrus communis TaxID=2448454 RepID=A0A5N5G0T6_9ROSA|nr:hypothetical protein D8674_012186 [Pyrus ussuriensis x Pyrus communis]
MNMCVSALGPNRMLKLAHNVRVSNEKIKITYDLRHQIPERTKKLVQHELSVIYNLEDISPEATAYLEENLATWYKNWKCELHAYFKKWDDPKITRLEGYPIELLKRPED